MSKPAVLVFLVLLAPQAYAQEPTTTTYDFMEGTAPFDVDTERLYVGMPLPNQWTCGVRITFTPDGGTVPIHRLLDALEITVEMPGAEPVIEYDETAGTLLVRTTAQAWYDRVLFATRDGSSLAATLHIQLYPWLVEPPPAILEVVAAHQTPSGLVCPD